MKWDTTGISVYFFPRGAIPDDITQGTPVPSTWGLPQANFPSDNCDPFKYFKDNFVRPSLCLLRPLPATRADPPASTRSLSGPGDLRHYLLRRLVGQHLERQRLRWRNSVLCGENGVRHLRRLRHEQRLVLQRGLLGVSLAIFSLSFSLLVPPTSVSS